MNNIASKILIFAAGATIGSLSAWWLTKKKYEQLAQEEINAMREYYQQKKNELDEKQEKLEEQEEERRPTFTKNKPDIFEYAKRISDLGYDSALPVENEMRGEPITMDRPHVITYESFDTVGYETVSYTYYIDGVLTDEMDNIVEDPDVVVGDDFADHFGENEGDEDSVYIRNDELRLDIEILRDNRNFEDVVGPGE